MIRRFVSDKLPFLPFVLLWAACTAMPMGNNAQASKHNTLEAEEVTFQTLPTFLPEIKEIYASTKADSLIQKEAEMLQVYKPGTPATHEKLKALLTPLEPKANEQAFAKKSPQQKNTPTAQKDSEKKAHQNTLTGYLASLNLASQMIEVQHNFALEHLHMMCYWECLRTHRDLSIYHQKMLDSGKKMPATASDYNKLLEQQRDHLIELSQRVIKNAINSKKELRDHIIENMNIAEKWMSPEAIEFLRELRHHSRDIEKEMTIRDVPKSNAQDSAQGNAMHKKVLTYAHVAPYFETFYKALRLSANHTIEAGIALAGNDTAIKKRFTDYLMRLGGGFFAPDLTHFELEEQYKKLIKAHYILRTRYPECSQQALRIPHFVPHKEDSFIEDEINKTEKHVATPQQLVKPKKKKKSRKKQNANVHKEAEAALNQELEIATPVRTPQENRVVAADGSYFIHGNQQGEILIYDPKNNATLTLHEKIKLGNEPTKTACKYNQVIKQWFAQPELALKAKLQEEGRLPSEVDDAQKKAKITIHNIAQVADTFLKTHASEFITHTRPKQQESERALIMPGTITYGTGKQETGYLAYLFEPNKRICFHRMFDVRMEGTPLANELNQQNCFDRYTMPKPQKK